MEIAKANPFAAISLLTNGGLSINLRQLFISVGELSSSELGERDWLLMCKLLLSLLWAKLNK